MSDGKRNRKSFVIPQKKAGKRFKEMTDSKSIDGVSLEMANGTQLGNLPIQVNVNKIVPRVFRMPMRAGIAATSAVARVFGLRITFELQEDES